MPPSSAPSRKNIARLQRKAAAAAGLLKLIANETRLQILCQLVESEKAVNEIEDSLGLRQSALSQHLAILRRERIVKTRREAQFIYYSLASPEAAQILTTLSSIYCGPG